MIVKNSQSRRGALLLVILGLLAMFGLVAVALVVLCTQEKRSSYAARLIDQAADPPQRTLDEALRQIVRGSNNPGSVMGPHSLLETMYGNTTISGTINGVSPLCNGQLLELALSTSAGNLTASNTTVRCVGGCVITDLGQPAGGATQSPAAGQSSILVGVNPTSGQYQMAALDNGAQPQANDLFLINGAPFSGAGLGYTASGGTDNCYLKPGSPLSSYGTKDANGVYNPPCGANSDYTAPDYGHMLLAAQLMQNGVMYTPIPSMHRSALVQSAGGTPNRNIMLRPIQDANDHPNFTGSNPYFSPTWDGFTQNGSQWDVDNTGSGVPDSVWVDLGLPVRADKYGRLYKPLFAILCVDLDGRLNLNAHGNNGQATQSTTNLSAPQLPGGGFTVITTPGPTDELSTSTSSSKFAGPATGTIVFPRGIGYGPGEINLLPLFQDPSTGTFNYTLYNNLLSGSTIQSIPGRYAELGGTPDPGIAGQISPLAYNKWYDFSGNYWGQTFTGQQADAYGSPPDARGYAAIGLDGAGRPLFLNIGAQITNSPYDMDLSRNAARGLSLTSSNGTSPPDDAFGVAELERLLRAFDRDSTGLPSRLFLLTGGTGTTPSVLQNKRDRITAESWDNPCPAVAVPKALRTTLGYYPRHITDLLIAAQIPQSQWGSLVAPEMLAGLKLNLNRPLGVLLPPTTTGMSNGTWQASFSQFATSSGTTSLSSSASPATFSYDPNGANFNNSTSTWLIQIQARQRLARYLFVLAMLLRDNSTSAHVLPVTSTNESGNQTALDTRRLAQWAINAVCFQTNDSIMVPFKYDLNPLTAAGWQSDDDITNVDSTKFGVVWGCKPPELLLTEAAAFHNRGVGDTKFATPSMAARETSTGNGTTTPYTPANPDMDQVRVPQGSLFIELYCTRSPTNQSAPTDLYTYNATTGWCWTWGEPPPTGRRCGGSSSARAGSRTSSTA